MSGEKNPIFKPGMRVYHHIRDKYGTLISFHYMANFPSWDVEWCNSSTDKPIVSSWYEMYLSPANFDTNKEASILLSEEG